MSVLIFYVVLFAVAFFGVQFFRRRRESAQDFTSLKTVTFGDESAVRPDRAASIISIVSIFLIWGAFTGSILMPIHVPGPFSGTTSFTYTAQNSAGDTDDATVTVIVHALDNQQDAPEIEAGDGFAKNDSDSVAEWRSTLIRAHANDDGSDQEGYAVIEVDGQPISPGDFRRFVRGSCSLRP